MNALTEHVHIERTAMHDAVLIPVALLKPNPYNRKAYDTVKMAELVKSVQTHDVIQPIIARPIEGAPNGAPQYEIVAGERRWRASTTAGLATVPTLLKRMTDLELMELLLVENKEREDMNALDEASVLQQMLRKPDGMQGYATVDELAAKIGRSRVYVFQRLKLLTLCDAARDALLAGDIEASHALIVARIPNAADQAAATQRIVNGYGGNRMSVRDAQEFVHREYMLDLAGAAFPITSATLLPAAGSCTDCSKRTGANPDLFADIKKGDNCTDGACYHLKEEAHRDHVKAQAEADGKKVLTEKEAKKAKPSAYGSLKGLLKLDDVHHQIDGKQTLRKLLGKGHTLEVLLFEDPHSHALYDVVREDDALKLLKERGVIKREAMPTTSAQQRDTERKVKAERAWRKEVARCGVETAPDVVTVNPDVRASLVLELVLLLWQRLENDHSQRVAQLVDLGQKTGSRYDPASTTAFEAYVRGLDPSGFARLVAAMLLTKDSHPGEYGLTQKPERLLRVAQLLGVDVKAIQKQMRDEALARVPAPTKPAARKAAKPTRASNPVLTPEQALAAALNADAPAFAAATAPKGVKYHNAATGETWTGRGLKPKWLVAQLGAGKCLSDFDVTARPPAAAAGKPTAEGGAA